MLESLKEFHRAIVGLLGIFADVPALFFRLALAYGFYQPAVTKWKDIGAISTWFESMGYPLPTVNAYLAATTEASGVLLLTIGLATRLISVPLMVVMMVAAFTVHWSSGFAACQCSAPGGPKFGFEIPFYYFLMLFYLFIRGPGRISLDALIYRWAQNSKPRGKMKSDIESYSRSW